MVNIEKGANRSLVAARLSSELPPSDIDEAAVAEVQQFLADDTVDPRAVARDALLLSRNPAREDDPRWHTILSRPFGDETTIGALRAFIRQQRQSDGLTNS